MTLWSLRGASWSSHVVLDATQQGPRWAMNNGKANYIRETKMKERTKKNPDRVVGFVWVSWFFFVSCFTPGALKSNIQVFFFLFLSCIIANKLIGWHYWNRKTFLYNLMIGYRVINALNFSSGMNGRLIFINAFSNSNSRSYFLEYLYYVDHESWILMFSLRVSQWIPLEPSNLHFRFHDYLIPITRTKFTNI